MRSSTTRKRPSVSMTAATVTSGLSGMLAMVAVAAESIGASAPAGGAQAVLGCARVPHAIELTQVELRHGRVVEIRDAVPGIGAHAEHDRPVVGDQIGGGALWRIARDVADVDAARKTTTHGDEPVAVPHDARRLH